MARNCISVVSHDIRFPEVNSLPNIFILKNKNPVIKTKYLYRFFLQYIIQYNIHYRGLVTNFIEEKKNCRSIVVKIKAQAVHRKLSATLWCKLPGLLLPIL